MKLTKSKLKQLIKEELTFGNNRTYTTDYRPFYYIQFFYLEFNFRVFVVIEMGKKDDSEDPARMTAATVFDALEEWANQESFEHVRISSLYQGGRKMKLTKARLQQIIKEELKTLNENFG